MKRETIVNTFMILLVAVVAIGSGLMVEKNLHDKETREKQEALIKTSTHFEDFLVQKVSTDSAVMQKDGFIKYKGKMYRASGDTVSVMTMNILLPSDIKVMIDGRIIRKDGTSRVLTNNEMINLNGAVIPANRDLNKITIQQPFVFNGKQIAGKIIPYIDFNQTDYQNAINQKKTIFLYFYADWDPICQIEEPQIETGFDTLNVDNVVGFRVNYNDSHTDTTEKQLAQKFSVTYQHTKVIVKNGVAVYRTEDQWGALQLVSVITNNL